MFFVISIFFIGRHISDFFYQVSIVKPCLINISRIVKLLKILSSEHFQTLNDFQENRVPLGMEDLHCNYKTIKVDAKLFHALNKTAINFYAQNWHVV